MLGILKMTIEDCIKTFTEMMAEIFVHKKVSFLSLMGKVKGRYSTVPLEKCITAVLADHGKAGFKMREASDPDPSCKV